MTKLADRFVMGGPGQTGHLLSTKSSRCRTFSCSQRGFLLRTKKEIGEGVCFSEKGEAIAHSVGYGFASTTSLATSQLLARLLVVAWLVASQVASQQRILFRDSVQST